MRAFVLFAALLLPGLHAGATELNPITRVVQLLDGLQTECEENRKKEEDGWETFVCWKESVIRDKEASNKAAEERIGVLSDMITQLKDGKNANTDAAVKIDQQVQENIDEKQEVEDQCEQDRAAYNATAEDLASALNALNLSMATLKEAQDFSEINASAFLQTANKHTFQDGQREAMLMDKAVELANRFLGKGDALYVSHILRGDPVTSVPKGEEKDWNKLNDNTLTEKYESRNGKIIRVFELLMRDFQDSADEAEDENDKGIATCNKRIRELKGVIAGLKQEAQELRDKTGSDIPSLQDCEDEKAALVAQVSADEGFIQDTINVYNQRYDIYVQRKKNQLAEISAIEKAKAELSKDDNRDLFGRSYESQGYLFLQLDPVEMGGDQSDGTNESAHGLSQLIDRIDELVDDLAVQQGEDDDSKETAENASIEYANNAMNLSRQIDEQTLNIHEKVKQRAKLREQQAAAQKLYDETVAEIAAAVKERAEEHAAWEKTNQDDLDAAQVVKGVKDDLAQFYHDLKTVPQLLQAEPYKYVASEAGSAPPPPPATIEKTHKGSQDAATGIVAIMGMIEEDIEKDRADAETEENTAQTAFEKLTTELGYIRDNQTCLVNNSLTDCENEKGYVEMISDKDSEITEAHEGSDEGSREQLRISVNEELNSYSENRPIARYWQINYEPRMKHRQTEVDGLKDVKHILKSETGTFNHQHNETYDNFGNAEAAHNDTMKGTYSR